MSKSSEKYPSQFPKFKVMCLNVLFCLTNTAKPKGFSTDKHKEKQKYYY